MVNLLTKNKMDRRTVLKTKSNSINQNRYFQTLKIKIKTTINFKRQKYNLILLICSYPSVTEITKSLGFNLNIYGSLLENPTKLCSWNEIRD